MCNWRSRADRAEGDRSRVVGLLRAPTARREAAIAQNAQQDEQARHAAAAKAQQDEQVRQAGPTKPEDALTKGKSAHGRKNYAEAMRCRGNQKACRASRLKEKQQPWQYGRELGLVIEATTRVMFFVSSPASVG